MKRLAILISGGGTTAEAIIKACQEKRLRGILPTIVISSRFDALGIQKAKNLGVKTIVISPKEFKSKKEFGKRLIRILKKYKIDLVSQNGWLPLTPKQVTEEYRGRIINQHPGPLDPGRKFDFGGKEMYGARVMCARLAYAWLTKEKKPWTEATVHFANEQYDKGDLLRTEKMSLPPLRGKFNEQILKEKTLELQKQLLPLEHKNVIESLRMLAKGEVKGFRRKKPLIHKKNEKILLKAKEIAFRLFPKG